MPLHLGIEYLQHRLDISAVARVEDPPLKASTFSCDIAYSERPAASRALAGSEYSVTRTTAPSLKAQTCADPHLDFCPTHAGGAGHTHDGDHLVTYVEKGFEVVFVGDPTAPGHADA